MNMENEKLLSEKLKNLIKETPRFEGIEDEISLRERLESFQLPDLPIKEYPCDEYGRVLVPSEREWDEE